MRVRCLLLALLGLSLVPASAQAVVGGRTVTREYPAMAALYEDGGFTCGASLVAPSWILTAAHCVEGVTADRLEVQLGAVTRSQPPASAERLKVDQVVVHEQYNSPNPSSNDVALLHLPTASKKEPIAIGGPSERALWAPNKQARIIGWGSEVFLATDVTDQLREVDLPIVSDNTCKLSYALTFPLDPTTMVCAGMLLGTRDACNGDSGGPLMVNSGGQDFLIGVVSYGLGCGYPTQYGVYARVGDPALGDWIRQRIASPPPAATAAAAPAMPKVKIGKVSRKGRKVAVRITSTGTIRGLKVTLARVKAGKRTALRSASRAKPNRKVTVHLVLRKGTKAPATVRVEVRAKDRKGRAITVTRTAKVAKG